jgi:hypothetical protein
MENLHTELDGRVRKLSLPVIEGRPGPDAPLLKRLALPQGELAQFWDGQQGIHYLAMMELKAGVVRGNHYHRRKREWVYVICGEVDLFVAEPGGGRRVCLKLGPGDLGLIEPEVVHAYKVLSPGYAVEFSPQPFDPADNCPEPLV